jgi:hypothetical protein
VALEQKQPADLLMWVGSIYYSTITDFVAEAKRLGVSKRVPPIPVDFCIGESVLFLAHDEGVRIECEHCRGTGIDGSVAVRLMVKQKKDWVQAVKAGRRKKIESTVSNRKMFDDINKNTKKASRGRNKWVFVEGQTTCPSCEGKGTRPKGVIFGLCVPSRFERVFDSQGAANEYKLRMPTGSREVPTVGGFDHENERGCGYRKIGAYYLVTDTTLNEVAQDLSMNLYKYSEVHGPLIVFKKPVPYDGYRFRGVKVVSRKDIFGSMKRKTRGRTTSSRSRSSRRNQKPK